MGSRRQDRMAFRLDASSCIDTLDGVLSARRISRVPALDLRHPPVPIRAKPHPGGPMITGCLGIVGVPLLSHLGSTLIFPDRIRELHRQWDASTIQRLYFPEHPTDEERALSATSAYVAQFYSQGPTSPQRSQTALMPRATPTSALEAESSTQAAMRAKLHSIREERDRLRCELVDSRTEVGDYRELQTELARARVTILDREMARLSATLDRTRARARRAPIPRISGRPHFALARTYAALSRPSSAKGCWPMFMFLFLPCAEVNPPALAHSQSLPTHAPPPPTPAGVSPAYSGAPSMHLPPPTSLGAPLPRVLPASSTSDDHARIAALEGTRTESRILELHASFGTRANSRPDLLNSTDTSPGECGCSRPANNAHVHGSPVHQPLSAATGPHGRPSSTGNILIFRSGLVRATTGLHTGPSRSLYRPSTDGFSGVKRTCSSSPSSRRTSSLPERRLKRMEETIRALQANETRPNASYGDCSLFLDMRLPLKVRIPEFKTYEGTTDPRQHLRHYRGKMLQYWDCEEFVIHSFQDSLSGSALDWFKSLKAEDIPTWADLSRKFIDQFEEYATKWRAQAAKHIPPISEVQQIQLFYSTLRGVYYSHLLAHTSSFSNLIEAGKKLDLGIKLGRMEGPTSKGEESSKKASVTTTSSSGRRGKEISVNAVNPAHTTPQQYSAPGVESPSTGAAESCFTRSTGRRHAIPISQAVHTSTCSPFSTYIDNSLRAIRFSRYPRARTLTRPLKISLNTANIIKANPLFDHRSSSGSSINMITICTLGEDANAQDNPLPFVIDYTLEKPTVGFAGHMASPAPFVVDIPTREPYSDNKVPWTYEGGIGGIEQQFSVMGVTRSGRVYENPVIIDKGKASTAEVGVVPESTPFPSKRMNVDLNGVRPSETAVRAFDGSQREANEEIDFLIDVGPCSFSITFQKLITVKGEEDYAIYKETAVPYISVGDDENLPFHSFETISFIRDYGKIGPFRADPMIGKVLLRHNYIPSADLEARGQGINRPIEVEEYKNRRGLGFRRSCHEIIEARKGNHLHGLATHYGKLNRGIPVPPLSHFFPGPPHIIGGTLDGPSSDSDDTPVALSTVYAFTEEIPSWVHIRLVQENEGLDNWTSVPRYSAVIADMLHSNPNLRHFDSNPFEERLEESLRRLEDHQITSVEPTEEINVGIEEESRTLKIGTALDPAQRARMIDFLREYQEFPPKRQQLRRQRASLLLRIKEEVVKQINAGFLEVCNYSEWVANIVPVEKKDGRVRVCVDYRDLNKASP
ncbi:hypothetical protein CRG98_023110 [Punica granatum]|uniref:Retrotransposon gag domain-containing protein n=1 Tax=Punica granatum TaxID=22663 RepID=A0A2I0JJM8_PUNGR|nr:hypothetical protein CRG98_023110 [Punica granatum]